MTDRRRSQPARPATPAASQAATTEDVLAEGRLALVLTLAILGAVAAGLFDNAPGLPDAVRDRRQGHEGHAAAWILLVAIQTGTWLALLPAVIGALRRDLGMVERADCPRRGHCRTAGAPVLRGHVLRPSPPGSEAFSPRLSLITVVGSLIGLLAAAGVARTQMEITTLAETTAGRTPRSRSTVISTCAAGSYFWGACSPSSLP